MRATAGGPARPRTGNCSGGRTSSRSATRYSRTDTRPRRPTSFPPDGERHATESAQEALHAWIDYARSLEDQVEQLRVQLAGCSVAASGHAKGSNDAAPGDYGHSVAFDDVKRLRRRHDEMLGLVDALWSLLDDIDSSGDVAKDDDATYRRRVERIQKKRWDTGVVTDGHHVFVKGWPSNRRPGWLDRHDPHHPAEGPTIVDQIGPEIFAGTSR